MRQELFQWVTALIFLKKKITGVVEDIGWYLTSLRDLKKTVFSFRIISFQQAL